MINDLLTLARLVDEQGGGLSTPDRVRLLHLAFLELERCAFKAGITKARAVLENETATWGIAMGTPIHLERQDWKVAAAALDAAVQAGVTRCGRYGEWYVSSVLHDATDEEHEKTEPGDGREA